MAENSKIEWTDHTFNPWRGCTKVSPGCANCYAETLSKRNPKVLGEWGKGKPRVLASEAMWREPFKWDNRHDEALLEWEADFAWQTLHGIVPSRPRPLRPRVFCASLADWLDDEVPIEWLTRLLELIATTPHLDWLLLTKRPENWYRRVSLANGEMAESWIDCIDMPERGAIPENVWIGTSVEDQARAEERIPALLQIPATVRFLSCEPLLGPVDLEEIGLPETCDCCGAPTHFNAFTGRVYCRGSCDGPELTNRLHWVIAGGESGPKARPMHPDWARSLRDQCVGAGVPFLFKQWGEFRPAVMWDREGELEAPSMDDDRSVRPFADGPAMLRLGKKQAGRLLDGREWNGFPVTTQKGGRGA